MNFSRNQSERKYMAAGDTVIIYERHDSLSYIQLQTSKVHDNKFGTFHHNDFIGKPFGTKIYSRGRSGWIYALEPTPELWSHALHTRTQIVDESDASYITCILDVYPGCKVIESGTGSGNMSMSLARAVSPNGQVFTFEYNASRAEEATKEFKSLGVGHLVTVQCRDVCAVPPTNSAEGGDIGGFGPIPAGSIDAVFLDLPNPWLALAAAKTAMKPGKNICCYSPCMEQVIRTCEELRKLGFHSIRMIELRQRPFEGRVLPIEVPDLGRRIENNPCATEDSTSTAVTSDHKVDEEIPATAGDNEGTEGPRADKEADSEQPHHKKRRRNAYEVKTYPPRMWQVARPNPTMKGHTAFLTFAVAPATHSSDNHVEPSSTSKSSIGYEKSE